MTPLAAPEAALDGVLASTPEPLPFDESLHIRAFALRREEGNLLVYSTTGLETDAAAIGDAGGIARQYLNHRHEAAFASPWVSAPLFVHERERASVERATHVRGSFTKRHTFGEDFEAVPTPGHTPGATAYLWEHGGHRFLFTGDTIYLREGEWVAAVLGSSDREAYIDSLELIRGLDFDVLVPWAAGAGEPWYSLTDDAGSRRRIDAIVERLRDGEDR